MGLSEKETSLKTSKNRTNLLFCLIPTETKEERRVSPTNYMSLKEEESGKQVSGSRRFSRVWKAVLSEPSTGKMIKKGKSDKKAPKTLTTESARYDYNKTKRSKDEFDFDLEHRLVERSASALAATAAVANLICPTCSSPLTAARTATTTVESNSDGSNKTSAVNAESQSARVFRSSDCGLLLMLMSLLVLVFWGKLCAVFWTATWLFLAPHWTVYAGHVGSPPPGMFKEKVVMEGFLARERRRSIPCQ